MEITYNGRKLELSFGFKALNAIDRKLGVEAEQMKFEWAYSLQFLSYYKEILLL